MIRPYVGEPLRLEDIDHALDRWWGASDGGAAVLVGGPPGGGQHAVIESLERRARAAAIPTVSLWVAPGRPRLLSAVALGESLGAGELDTAEPATLSRHLRRAFRSLTGPLLVLVYGLEELPEDDAAILEDLLCSPPDGRLLLVATVATRRVDGQATVDLGSLAQRAAHGGRCRVVELAPLSPEEVSGLLEAELGTGAAGSRFAREFAQLTEGRLDDARDTLDVIAGLEPRERSEVLAGSRRPQALAAPESVRARTAAALRAMPEERQAHVEAVATSLAVWGFPATLDVIETLSGLPALEVEDATDLLARAGLVRESSPHEGDVSVELASALVGSALIGQVSALARRRLHRLSAQVLEGRLQSRGSLTEEETLALARHSLAGALSMHGDRAAMVGSAARLLVERGRFADARERLQALDRLLGGTPETEGGSLLPASLSALLAETLSRSGEWDAAKAVLSRPPREFGPSNAARAEMRRARDRVALGQDDDAWVIYERLVSRDNPERDPEVTVARVEAARVLQTLGRTQQATEQAEQAFREASEAGDPHLAARALLSLHSILLTDGQPQAALEANRQALTLARQSGNPATVARVYSALGSTLVDLHSLHRGVPWLRRAIRQAEATDDFPTVSWTSSRLANALGEMGDLDGTERLALSAMHLDSTLHRMRALPRSHALLRTIDAVRGRSPEGRPEVLQFWHGREPLDQGYALNAEVMAATAEAFAAGDPRAAYEAVSTVTRLFKEITGRRRFLRCELIPWQIEAALRMRDPAAAQRASEDLLALADDAEPFPLALAEMEAGAGRAALAQGALPEAIERLGRAADAFGEIGYAWRRARALRALAEAGIQAGEPDAVLPALEEAHQFAAAGGLASLRDIRALYTRIGRRPPRLRSTSELSEREREVARLAAQGMTDAEIAVTLGIQRRTVTTHMHNILTKSGLRSRVELKNLGGLGA